MSSIARDELARLVALQRVMQHAVTCPRGAADIETQQAEGYASLGVLPADGRALAATDGRRIGVYRKLVRGTLADAIRSEIPRTAARLGLGYDALLETWFAEELPRSQVLRDVAFELAAWAEPRLKADDPHLADLMRYELFEFDVYTAPHPDMPVSADLGADQRVAFSGSTRLARFDHAVHRLADDVDDRTVAEARPSGVLGYRDAEGKFRQMDLTPMATAILAELLLAHQPLAPAVGRACQRLDKPVTPQVVEGISKVLADLADRGVVLGGQITPQPPPDPSPFFRWLYEASSQGARSERD